MDWMEEFKKMEENESEDINHAFICCICRDLLYKPVILVCGHVSCFWCVHFSMDGLNKSSCPVCRNQYVYFPFVCQMLHLLIQKLYPEAYARREKHTLEEETRKGHFSPEIHIHACVSQPEAATQGEKQNIEHEPDGSAAQGVPFDNLESSEDSPPSFATDEGGNTFQMHNEELASELKPMVSCGSCKEMLIQPVAFNCGHVFCKSCIVPPTMGTLKCEICQTPHPGATPKVCLELDHFLAEQFPREYVLRKDILSKKQGHLMTETHTACSSNSANEDNSDTLSLLINNPDLHVGVGCDYCGMYPIIGDRYRCLDCVELMGFDLCKDCYTSQSKLPGRFNQQHTSDHKFEVIKRNPVRERILLSWSLQFLGPPNPPSSDTAAAAVDSDTDVVPEDDHDGSSV